MPATPQTEQPDKPPQGNETRPSPSDSVRKAELKRLIVSAASGDLTAVRRLIGPFVAPEEKLLMHGVSAKFGIFPTYDFYFLTDRRIGDLEVTPLTGNLNVEVAYIQKIDAFVLSQPAFPILFRLFMAFMYLFLPLGFYSLTAAFFGGLLGFPTTVAIVFGIAAAIGAVLLVFVAVNPALKRAFLHFKKSGLWLKLNGNPVGILIFADRGKFELLTSLTRKLSDVKRQLDKVAS